MDVNAKGSGGKTPLYWAALRGRKEIADSGIAVRWGDLLGSTVLER